MTPTKAPRRRYDANTVEDICQRLRAGESLLRISKDPDMPSQRSLSDWVAKNHLGFTEKYLEAKRVAAHFFFFFALDEAYNTADDFYVDDDGRPVFDGHHVQRSKLIIDTIKWEVSKMLPRIYGDKVTQEFGVTGDLAALIEAASNRDSGLPPPIEGEISQATDALPEPEIPDFPDNHVVVDQIDGVNEGTVCDPPRNHYLQGFKTAPSTPSNQRRNRRRKRRT